MTLYPCPKCGQEPTVTYQDTPTGPVWTADCGCVAIQASNKIGLAYSWATYCVKMEDEMEEERP